MVGEVETVSTTFSYFRGGLFWVGGFAIIFLTIVVIFSLFDTAASTASGRVGTGSSVRRPGGDANSEASMGLTPETAAPAEEK